MENKRDTQKWKKFAEKYSLTEIQVKQFQLYFKLIVEYNQRFNLTAITDLDSVLAYHFEDSIELTKFIDIQGCRMVSDIGTGAGLPGIPLKIMYPHVPVVLVEVIQKKVDFLNLVIQELGLEGIEVCMLDWRTFLRKTEYPIDLVCARASLRPDELTRMFKGSSPYQNGKLCYWASADWQVGQKESSYFLKEYHYSVGDKKRKYAIFKK